MCWYWLWLGFFWYPEVMLCNSDIRMLSLNFALMEIGIFHIVFQNDTITTPTTPCQKKKKCFLQLASPMGLILRLSKLKEQACNINWKNPVLISKITFSGFLTGKGVILSEMLADQCKNREMYHSSKESHEIKWSACVEFTGLKANQDGITL